jgi:hypothetical protein
MGIIVRNEIVSPITGQVLPEAFISISNQNFDFSRTRDGSFYFIFKFGVWSKKKAFDDKKEQLLTTTFHHTIPSDDSMVTYVTSLFKNAVLEKHPTIDIDTWTFPDGTFFKNPLTNLSGTFDSYNECIYLTSPFILYNPNDTRATNKYDFINTLVLYSNANTQAFISGLISSIIAGYTDATYVEEV